MPRVLRFTQNFLKEHIVKLVFSKHIKLAKLSTVLDIGAGSGSITKWLLDTQKGQVLAFEVDAKLRHELEDNFSDPKLKIYGDYFAFKVGQPYEVVSNIPFMSTARIIEKLTEDKYFKHGYLVMQIEAGERFAGSQIGKPSTLRSVLLNDLYKIKLLHTFSKSDYTPSPSVTTGLFEFTRNEKTQIPADEQLRFTDFVTYLFSHSHPIIRRSPILGRHLARKINFEYIDLLRKSPTELSFDDYAILFKYCDKETSYKIFDEAEELKEQQSTIKKVHRTRLDKDWKNEPATTDRDLKDNRN